jgi:hypothetical protein
MTCALTRPAGDRARGTGPRTVWPRPPPSDIMGPVRSLPFRG